MMRKEKHQVLQGTATNVKRKKKKEKKYGESAGTKYH
jgi:hypothetical protein